MPAAVLIWVWFCAYLNFAGWALSALHELNARGYAVAVLLGLAALVVWRKKIVARNFSPHPLAEIAAAVFAARFRWRF